ncbi:MAG: peptidoglycan editing factor PgeF [Rhodoferax sp.]|jgi:YfiH family protein|uniref:peptidoglycan editing factor PgeF n=1 Tax=Rhodoferax sp. TaxID=50421 RepID=UPI001B3E334A|nr:peptidoglycan editing factor PgeF [Rhodoferax sp.]MBP8287083.1 peptidoglycan editing factor PgeF [Rhodoferax sp.]MBP9735802.1 peptidoglycan editing factor PgeF [Rhodoferax sp.]
MAFNAPDWLIPDWPVLTGVQAVCSTRQGGVSAAPYNSLNLGDHVGDEAAHVAANRALFQRGLGVPPVFLNQVHGTDVVHLNTNTPHGLVADAAVTNQPGVACTIMVADCLPVLLANRSGTLVAAAHAGWRGLAGQGGLGILEATYQRLSALAQSAVALSATEMQAWLGPCIGPQAFEVGDEVREVFVAHDALARQMFQRDGDKWLADLAGLARQRLNAMGITRVYGNDSSAPWCTVGNPSRFFSHRRDRISGRMAVAIWRTGA